MKIDCQCNGKIERFLQLGSLVVVSLLLLLATAKAEEGAYIGVFGGIGNSGSTSLQQQGTVFLNPPNRFPVLPIDAKGPTNHNHEIPVGGIQLGYEWSEYVMSEGWSLQPAAELEGIYIGRHTPLGVMPVTPAFLGTQYVTIPMTTGLLMVNGVFTLETPITKRLLPYVGGGIGAAFISIRGADSANPMEPGINHFNTSPSATDFAFAFQLRAGVKAEVVEKIFLFLEYRYLSISPTQYTFGETNYPGLHLPTTDWQVDLGRQEYHLMLVGIQYKF